VSQRSEERCSVFDFMGIIYDIGNYLINDGQLTKAKK
jgi:hypothetical protein